ncbi:hypothetical protein MMC13_003986 [Lambiella insularis]|nr:hypothetical protein [Lambiella insularis]
MCSPFQGRKAWSIGPLLQALRRSRKRTTSTPDQTAARSESLASEPASPATTSTLPAIAPSRPLTTTFTSEKHPTLFADSKTQSADCAELPTTENAPTSEDKEMAVAEHIEHVSATEAEPPIAGTTSTGDHKELAVNEHIEHVSAPEEDLDLDSLPLPRRLGGSRNSVSSFFKDFIG